MRSVRTFAIGVCLVGYATLLGCVEDPLDDFMDDTDLFFNDAVADFASRPHASTADFVPGPGCVAAMPGSRCDTEWGSPGVCVSEPWGYDYCASLGSCEAAQDGALCTTEWAEPGVCVAFGETTICLPTPTLTEGTVDAEEVEASSPCDGMQGGAPCVTGWGERGLCTAFGSSKGDGRILGVICEASAEESSI